MKYLEAVLVVAMFGVALWLGAFSVRQARHAGTADVPGFNRRVHAAALMGACGRGLTTPSAAIADVANPRPQDRALVEFVMTRRDTIDCSEVPVATQGDGLDGLQRASRYLLLTFTAVWKLFGASWNAIDWLLGVFFATSTVAAYTLCRLAMPWWAAAGVSSVLLISPRQREFLPDLRDYSKAPFFLITLVVLGFCVMKPRPPWTVIAATAAGGAAIAIGFGMRTDTIINLAVLLAGVGLFLPGAFHATWRIRGLAVAAGALAFVVAAAPLLSNQETNSSPWHVSLLGFADVWNESLGIEEGPYQLGHFYSDSYVATQVDAFWARTSPGKERVSVGFPHYAEASRAYFLTVLRTFPADMALRAWAALLRVLEMPYVAALKPAGPWLFVVSVLATSVVSVRLALLLCAVVFLLGAYPSLQFQPRHYFHLEIIGLWMAAFVISRVVPGTMRRELGVSKLKRPVAFAAAMLVIIAVQTAGLRAVQRSTARTLFQSYERAVVVPGAVSAPVEPPARSMHSDVIVAELSSADCGVTRPNITFRYAATHADADFTQTISVDLSSGRARVFFPVFQSGSLSPEPQSLRFEGVHLSDGERPCLVRLGRLAKTDLMPLLIPVVLTDPEGDRPLRQTLR